MANLMADAFADAALNIIKNNAVEMIVATGNPTNYDEAVANELATTYPFPWGTLDFTGPEDDVSGRKLTVGGKSGFIVTVDGTPTHLCLTNGIDTLLYQTTCTGAPMVAWNTVKVPPWKINLQDPI
jgi:hypothetical protein